jgi:hypothetical protein
MFWSTAVMTVGHLLFSAVYTVYVVAAVFIFEEPQLDAEHGGIVLRGRRSSAIPMSNLGATEACVYFYSPSSSMWLVTR